MKLVKLILGGIFLILALSPLTPVLSWATSDEELFLKIKMLELQIQELRAMKAQQNKTEEKAQHCIKAVGIEKFCTCLSLALPDDMSFEQYVHVIVAAPERLPDDSQKRITQGSIDAVYAARDKCMQK